MVKNKFIVMRPIENQYLDAYNYILTDGFKQSNMSITAYAKLLKITKTRLLLMYRLGIVCTPSGHYFINDGRVELWTNIMNDVFVEDISIAKVCRKYGTKRNTIHKYLYLFNRTTAELRDHKLTVKKDFKVFKEDTSEKWYWLGFLNADGGIFRNEVRLKLSHRDTGHLVKFCTFLSMNPVESIKAEVSTHASYKNGPVTTHKVVLHSSELVEYLKTFNIVPNKSCKELPPDNMPDNFVRDYIRGIFDGDGCIRTNLKSISIVNSATMVNWINDELLKRFNISGTISVKSPTSNLHEIVWYNLKDKLTILKYMYEDSGIYLERKYNLYKEVCRLE